MSGRAFFPAVFAWADLRGQGLLLHNKGDEKERAMNTDQFFDIIPLGICLWFIKVYFLGKPALKQEKFIVERAPKVFLYPATGFVCVMLLLLSARDFSFLSFIDRGELMKVSVFSFMCWISVVLYTKWDWGIHEAKRGERGKNNKEMLALVAIMLILGSMLQ